MWVAWILIAFNRITAAWLAEPVILAVAIGMFFQWAGALASWWHCRGEAARDDAEALEKDRHLSYMRCQEVARPQAMFRVPPPTFRVSEALAASATHPPHPAPKNATSLPNKLPTSLDIKQQATEFPYIQVCLNRGCRSVVV